MSQQASFWSELQKRHVVRAAMAHVVFFWLLVQVADVVLPYLGVIDNPVRWAVVVGVALFPVTLLVAWFFEHPWHRYTTSRLSIDLFLMLGISISALAWVKKNIPQIIHARTSIVIMPFDYGKQDPQGQFLSRALALQINSLLMKSQSIDVVGYESANSPALKGLDVPGIIEALDVQHVLSGVISSADESMNLSFSLHDRDGGELWFSELNDSIENLPSVQEQIAAEVQKLIGETGTGISVAEVAAGQCPMPTDPSALERFYTARHYVESRTDSEESRSQLREAVALYQALVDEFPDFAQAYSGMAWALHLRIRYDAQNSDRVEYRSRASELGEKAFEICNSLGEALVLIENEADHSNAFINEEQNLNLWMRMQPESTEAVEKYTFHLRMMGRNIEALEVAERNYRLNPLSIKAIKHLAGIYSAEDRHEEAVALENISFELGSTSDPFRAQQRALAGCVQDLDCMMENIPAPLNQHGDRLRPIYTAPESEQQGREQIEAAMALFADVPMLLNWLKGSACRFDHLTDLFFELWDSLSPAQQSNHWFWPQVWQPDCGNVWESGRFPSFLEASGMGEYFRVKQFPDACRPDGDSINCSEKLWREKRIAARMPVPG